MKRPFHKLKVKVMCLLGLAIDIHSKGRWPSCALSNFYPHQFEFEGVQCGSMEGFLQSLKSTDPERQIEICRLSRKEAKQSGNGGWKLSQDLYWDGKVYNRHGYEFLGLIKRAYEALYGQSPLFRDALKATGNKRLYHSIGNPNPHDTILTELEFCTILTAIRDSHSKGCTYR